MPEKLGFDPTREGEHQPAETNQDLIDNKENPKASKPEKKANPQPTAEPKVYLTTDETSKELGGNFRFKVGLEVQNRSGQTFRRPFKFIIPQELQHKLSEARPIKEHTVRVSEEVSKTFAQEGDNTVTVGENVFEYPEDQRLLVFKQMFQDNRGILSPRHTHLVKAKDGKEDINFTLDNQDFNVPFEKVKERVAKTLEHSQAFDLAIHFKRMSKEELQVLPDKQHRAALALKAIFRGIPSPMLELAKKYGSRLLDEYENAKGLQQKGGKISEEQIEMIRTFESLGLNLKDGEFSFVDEAVNEAFLRRLQGKKPELKLREEKKRHAKEKAERPEADKEILAAIQDKLLKVPFEKLDDVLSKLDERKREGIYFAVAVAIGHRPSDIVEDFKKLGLIAGYARVDIYRMAAKLGIESAKDRSKNRTKPEYSDKRMYDLDKTATFTETVGQEERIVAKRVIKAGTQEKFVQVAVQRPAKQGEDQKPRIFSLPLGENSEIVDSLEIAQSLRQEVADVFRKREEQGQRGGFSPFIQLKGGAKDNPQFLLTLGESQGVVSYKDLYGTLSFPNKVKAELLKSKFIENKKAQAKGQEVGDKWWQEAKDWERSAVLSFQNILANSGFPNLTEQLIVKELVRQVQEGSGKKKAKAGRPETMVPVGNIHPGELKRLEEDKQKLIKKKPEAKPKVKKMPKKSVKAKKKT